MEYDQSAKAFRYVGLSGSVFAICAQLSALDLAFEV